MTAVWKRIQSNIVYIRFYALALLLLWCLMTMVNTGTMVFNGASVEPADPFAEYDRLLPGQPSSALALYNFTCSANDARYSQTKYCIHHPSAGSFSLVEVFIDQSDKITEIDFTLHDGLFKVGDLMLLWGKPSVHPHPALINFIWENGAGATTPYSRHISFSLNVQKVYFMLHKDTIRPKQPEER